jgi:hypothetical protein
MATKDDPILNEGLDYRPGGRGVRPPGGAWRESPTSS